MEVIQDSTESGRHGCGKCFSSFSGPAELQEHQLSCFNDSSGTGNNSYYSMNDEEMTSEPVENDSFSITIDENESNEIASKGNYSSNLLRNSLSHPVFDPMVAKNNEPGGRCIRIVGGKKIMQCTVCLKTFTNYNSFKRHRRMHVSGASHQCNICGKNFYRRYLWRNHMERNHGNVEAIHEEKISSDSKQSSAHSIPGEGDAFSDSDVNRMKSHPCYLCKEAFKSRNELTTHQQRFHSMNHWVLPSPQKDINFNIELDENANRRKFDMNSPIVLDDMDEHTSDESSLNVFDASNVRSSPSPLSDLKENIPSNLHKSSNKSVVNQKISENSSDSEKSVSITIEPISNESGTLFPCPFCEKSFLSLGQLNDHKGMHYREKNFFCKYCCKVFGALELYMNHQLKHSSKNEYVCYVCNLECVGASELKVHYDATHKMDEEDAEIGDMSDSAVLFKSDRAVNVMINGHKNISGKSREYSCNVCGTLFDDRNEFKAHMVTHSVLFCKFCGKQFPSQKEVHEHRSKMSCSDVIACHVCSMSFISSEELIGHVVFHGEKHLSTKFSPNFPDHKSTMIASKCVDDILRKRELSQARKPYSERNGDFYADGSELSFKKSVVPSSSMHSAISVTLKPLDKNLRDAKMNSGNGKSHVCVHCGKDFIRQELLQRHMIRDHVFSKRLPEKGISESNKHSVLKSTSRKQITSKPVIEILGSKAKKVFPLAPLSKEITKNHTPPILIPSPHSISNKVSLLNPNKRSNTFKCKSCFKSFFSLISLNQHLTDHFVPHFCDFCGMPFSSKQELMTHFNGVHGKTQRYYCYACCTKVTGAADLKYHISICRGPPISDEFSSSPSPIAQHSFGTYKECKMCHKKFANEKRLMNHSCISSGSGDVWICDICNCSFPQPSHLASHQQQAHKSDEIYRCDVCGLSGHKDFIINHMITFHMTRVSTANNASPNKSNSLTITPISSSGSQTSRLTNVDSIKHSSKNSVYTSDSVFVTPKNPSEIQLMCNAKPITSSAVVDHANRSSTEFCALCEKTVLTSDFPEHMLREHCASVNVLPTNEKKDSLTSDTNVIEIITKDETKTNLSS